MSQKGWEVHVAVPSSPVVSQVQGWGYGAHVLPVRRGSLNPLSELRAIAGFRAVVSRIAPDLTHHFTSKAVLYGGLAGGRCVIATVTGIGFSLTGGKDGIAGHMIAAVSRSVHRVAFRRCKRVIFQNADDRDAFVRLGLLNESRAVVIQGSGVDMEANHPRMRAQHRGPVRFVMLSRLIEAKGVREYVQAARIVHQQHPGKFDFVLAGGLDLDNPGAIQQSEVDTWATEGIVRPIGQVPDAVAAFRGADVAVLPSYWLEGLPRSLIEAAALGLPVITTTSSGCRDALIPGTTGLAVTPRSSNELAAAMLQLGDDPELREAMGRAGREYVSNHFGIERVLQETWRVYEEALGQTPS